jgi:adenylyl- and sulfurtransferase ThiI
MNSSFDRDSNASNTLISPWLGAKREARWYRIILLHQNELGLKGVPFREKQTKQLTEDIKVICKREQLTLQSIQLLQDRMLFFFPNEEMGRAMEVFREILGIQSISPAITVGSDLAKIKETFLNFGRDVLQTYLLTDPNIKFSVKVKSNVKLGRRFEEIEQDFGRELEDAALDIPMQWNTGTEFGKGIRYLPKKSTYTFTIEVREKGAYLYARSIPTLWGGMPADLDKPLFCEWKNSARSLLAAIFLARRGAIVFPLKFQFRAEEQTLSEKMDYSPILAKYYAYSLPSVTINGESIINAIEKSITPGENVCAYCIYARLVLIEALCSISRKKTPISYAEHDLVPKGIIFPWSNRMITALGYCQRFPFLSLTPLLGLDEKEVRRLSAFIIQSENTGKEDRLECDYEIDECPFASLPKKGKYPPIAKISAIFNSPAVNIIIQEIVKQILVDSNIGTILNKIRTEL